MANNNNLTSMIGPEKTPRDIIKYTFTEFYNFGYNGYISNWGADIR